MNSYNPYSKDKKKETVLDKELSFKRTEQVYFQEKNKSLEKSSLSGEDIRDISKTIQNRMRGSISDQEWDSFLKVLQNL